MDRTQYFEELRITPRREGFSVLPEQNKQLPVEWDGTPLCRGTKGAGVRYALEDAATDKREQACMRIAKLTDTIWEYLQQMDQVPRLKAQRPTGNYWMMAECNGIVRTGNPAKHGVYFVVRVTGGLRK